ncbi:hypothetical protein ACIQI8_27325 [Streptomyces sp. NPDC092369]|uniref:hypothetical protein n=1 Tax=Streptomyces sp. NPDC092369 TaxID=3366015 RepID=UPI00380853E8
MKRIEKRLKALNPFASNPSTTEREKAGRRRDRETQEASERRAAYRGSLRGSGSKPRWPF